MYCHLLQPSAHMYQSYHIYLLLVNNWSSAMYGPNFLEKRSVFASFYKARMVMLQLQDASTMCVPQKLLPATLTKNHKTNRNV
jgi:hypothetical protein